VTETSVGTINGLTVKTILTVAFVALVGEVWAHESTLTPQQILEIQKACPAGTQCVIDASTGKIVPSGGSTAGSFQRIYAGPDILSIEETASSYFEEIADVAQRHPQADDPFNPHNLLRDRDGLNENEIVEVLAVTTRLMAPSSEEDTQAASQERATRRLAQCQALREATTPDAKVVVLESAERDAIRRREEKGRAFLDGLSDETRKHMRAVLIEYRKSMTVGRQDWKMVRDARPEALEKYRLATCNN
jgi:hypothetical protein